MKIPEKNAGGASSAQVRGTPTLLLEEDRTRGPKKNGGNGNTPLLGTTGESPPLPLQVTLGNRYEAPEPEGDASDSEVEDLPGGVAQSKSVNKVHHNFRLRKRERRVIVVTLF